MLYKLVRYGRAPFEMLQGGRSYESVRAAIHTLRPRLPAGIEVRSVYGWGFELWIDGVSAAE